MESEYTNFLINNRYIKIISGYIFFSMTPSYIVLKLSDFSYFRIILQFPHYSARKSQELADSSIANNST